MREREWESERMGRESEGRGEGDACKEKKMGMDG